MFRNYYFKLSLLSLFLLSCGGGSNEVDPNEVVVSSERIEVPNVSILSEGGEKQVTVNANCAWVITVPATDSWLSVNPMAGSNTQTITVSCTPNTSTNARTSVVSISGRQRTTAFKVTQNGLDIVAITINNFNFGTVTSSSVDYSYTFSPISEDISACGVCYSTSNNTPTIDDKVVKGTRSGNTVTGTINSLTTNTLYHMRAFVTNSSGTYYSQAKQVTTENNIPGSDDNRPPSTN